VRNTAAAAADGGCAAGRPPSLPEAHTAGCRIAREDARAGRSLTFRGVPCHVAAFSRGRRIKQASAPSAFTRGAPARSGCPRQNLLAVAATVPTIPSGCDIRAKEYRVELERHPRQTLASAQYYYVSIAGLSVFQQCSGRRRSIVIENMFSVVHPTQDACMTTEDTSVLPLREPVLCLGTLLISWMMAHGKPEWTFAGCSGMHAFARAKSTGTSGVADFHCHQGVSAAVPSRPACMLAAPAPCRHGLHVENISYEVRPLRCTPFEPVVGCVQNEMGHGPASVVRPFSEGLNSVNCADLWLAMTFARASRKHGPGYYLALVTWQMPICR
jgi:hypothetical protein